MVALDHRDIRQRQAKRLADFWSKTYVDMNDINRLMAVSVGTPAATGIPASGEREQTYVCHNGYSWLPRGLMLMAAPLGVCESPIHSFPNGCKGL